MRLVLLEGSNAVGDDVRAGNELSKKAVLSVEMLSASIV